LRGGGETREMGCSVTETKFKLSTACQNMKVLAPH